MTPGHAPANRATATTTANPWLRFAPAVALLAIGAATSVRDPHLPGSWGACPTYLLLGIYCPGCGSLRALHDLVTGDLAESVGHNVLVIPAIVFIAHAALRTPSPRWSWAWLGAFILFTIARNVPGSPLAP